MVAQYLETTVEYLIGGEAGAAYVRTVVRNDPKAIQVPDRIRRIVEDLVLLDEKELRVIQATASELAADKKGSGQEKTGTGSLPG